MTVQMRIAGTISLLATMLFGQDALPLPAQRSARDVRVGPGLSQPLWMSLAGRKVQGHRAHVLVEFATGAQAVPGLTLLEPAGGGVYYASLDLSSPFGADLQSGQAAALTRNGLRGIRVLEDGDKLPLDVPKAAFVNAAQTRAAFDVYFFSDTDLAQARTDLAMLNLEPSAANEYFQRLRIELEPRLLKQVAKLDWVQFITPAPAGKRSFDNRDAGTLIQVNTLLGADFNLTGSGVTLGIVDSSVPANHREFGGRVTNRDNPAGSQLHSTHVAGTMVAAGEFDPRLRGMATNARLQAWNFLGDEVAKMASGVAEIVAFNNSWGLVVDEEAGQCNEYAAYGGTERDLDRLVRGQNVSLVFATGNDKDLDICALRPQAGYYSVSRPATAKNVISVSAARPNAQTSEFGGAGPTRDGRIKPDLIAQGVGVRSTTGTTASTVLEGTSMAAPAVTGAIGLLAERYRTAGLGDRPPADLVKAILLNTAKDLGNPGPDYTYGFGLVQSVEAIKTLDDKRFARDKVTTGATRTHEFEVPASATSLRVLLNYSDLPAAPDTRSAVVNHLDIELSGPGGVTLLPLGLDPLKPNEAAQPRAGIRDVVKQIVADKPAAGKWTLTVKGLEVAEGEQDYAVTWTFAENPAPPCTATVSSTLEITSEKPELKLLHVNANTHCDAWQVTGAPEWLRVVGGNQKGTGVVKLSTTENTGDRARTARLNIAGTAVSVRQDPRCVFPIDIGQSIDAELSAGDCLFDFGGPFGPSFAYLRKYEFSGKQGQRIAINMISGPRGIDGYLFLMAPGDIILQDDDDSGGNIPLRDFSARIPSAGFYALPFTGTYTIWTTTALELESGPFTLRIDEGPAAPGGPITPRQIAACPATQTGELTSVSSTAGRRGDLFRTEVYQFFARLGAEVTIELPDASFDPWVYVINPSGRVAATITNDGSGTRRATITATRTGTYSVEVSTFAPFTTGTYSLKVEGCNPL